MKKVIFALALSFSLLAGGCTPGKIIEKISGTNNDGATYLEPTAVPTPHAHRVYMDEIIGTLVSFDGCNLTIQGEESSLTFNLSHAGLECSGGILGMDEVSVIYEGKLEEDSFKVLKVSDALHKKEPLKDYVLSGTLEKLTSYSATVKDKNGITYVLPSMGREATFPAGMIPGMPIFVKCLGKLPEGGDPSHPPILVKAISAKEDFSPMAREPLIEKEITDPYTQIQRLELTLQSLETGSLKAQPLESQISCSIDLNALPCYFPTGTLPGTRLALYYTGTYNGQDLNGLTLTEIRGLTSDASKPTLTGRVSALTQDTATLLCMDGSYFTFRNRGKNKLLLSLGDEISVTVNPLASKDTTIYTVTR